MKNLIEEIKNLVNSDSVVIACSTGIDSMVLLDLCLLALPKDQINVAHVNHGLREESKEEEKYIVKFSKEQNINYFVYHYKFDSLNNFENQARESRYNFFAEVAEKTNSKYILLAHHANDNLETIIMRMLKQSSLKGYAGIEQITKYKNTYLYRPLLKKSRLEIEQYANNNNIKYFNDYTNETDDYLRNRIRHHIIPYLEKENHNLKESINYFSETLLGANRLIEKYCFDFISEYVTIEDNNICFAIKDYLLLDEYLRKEVLFTVLKPYSLSTSMINELIKIITLNKDKVILQINDKLSFIKEYGKCLFTLESINELDFYLEIKELGTYNLPNNQKLIVDKNKSYFTTGTKTICYNDISVPFIIRTRKDGDKIRRKRTNKETKEVTFYSQKVNDVLTNKKIPFLDRTKTLLIVTTSDEVKFILGLIIS